MKNVAAVRIDTSVLYKVLMGVNPSNICSNGCRCIVQITVMNLIIVD